MGSGRAICGYFRLTLIPATSPHRPQMMGAESPESVCPSSNSLQPWGQSYDLSPRSFPSAPLRKDLSKLPKPCPCVAKHMGLDILRRPEHWESTSFFLSVPVSPHLSLFLLFSLFPLSVFLYSVSLCFPQSLFLSLSLCVFLPLISFLGLFLPPSLFFQALLSAFSRSARKKLTSVSL